ncbi:hypothetical protein DFH08DRAFT_879906 [Mycena albidolilacea]|uniref:Uncharacterized protein n=1 Tax=Mycena albidolilacea TaxID=1033008 RepID=A0AAD7EKA3_9AGAR|nr:hypothetical protein DFH08DRAFT_879906 [Mycena albidolilacea]
MRLYRTLGKELSNSSGRMRTAVVSETDGVCALYGKQDTSPPRELWPLKVDKMFALDGLLDCMSTYNISEMESGEVNYAVEDDMLLNAFVEAQERQVIVAEGTRPGVGVRVIVRLLTPRHIRRREVTEESRKVAHARQRWRRGSLRAQHSRATLTGTVCLAAPAGKSHTRSALSASISAAVAVSGFIPNNNTSSAATALPRGLNSISESPVSTEWNRCRCAHASSHPIDGPTRRGVSSSTQKTLVARSRRLKSGPVPGWAWGSWDTRRACVSTTHASMNACVDERRG